jgi:hypothetical protein
MKRSCAVLLVLCSVIGSAPASAQGAPAAGPSNPLFDLKVRVVVQTTPGAYAAINVPAGTVISTAPTGIINCPAAAGLAWATTTTDCSQTGLASNTNVMLQALFAIPNAHFLTWTDIMPPPPGTYAISNGCIYAATQTPPPNIKCTMAGMRNIQAVYECNKPTPTDPATYAYNDNSKTCQKQGGGGTACSRLMQNRTSCGFMLQINRGRRGTANYTVAVAPPAPIPTANAAPSTASQCVNSAGGAQSISCMYFYNTFPQTVVLTASSSAAWPTGSSWTGCTSFTATTCTIIVANATSSIVLHLPQ